VNCDLSTGNCYARGGILHFLLYDPSYSPTPDPRPSLPLTFTDPSLGRVLARTGWTNSATSFAYKCSWWVPARMTQYLVRVTIPLLSCIGDDSLTRVCLRGQRSR